MGNIRRRMTLLLLTMMILSIGRSAWAQGAPPAQIDKTSARTQFGLTLLAVTRGDAQGQYTFPIPANMDFLSGPRGNGPAGGIGLWVRGPKPPAPTFIKRNGVKMFVSSPFNQTPSASGTALNGDVIPMQVEPPSSGSYDPRGGQPAPLFLVTLPGGYPVGYPAIDVSMTGSQGHPARWRLIRLTAPYHAIAPPVAVHSNFTGAGVKISVRAWRDTGYSLIRPGVSQYQPMSMGIHDEMTAQVPAGSHWIVRIFKRQLEWEAVRPGELQALNARYGANYARQMPRQALWTAAFGPAAHSSMQDMVQTPYGKYNHFLRLSGELVQIASASENVTFHNLTVRQSAPPKQFGGPHGYTPPPSYEIGTRPQTQVTPSGISISLLPLSALGPQGSQFGGYGSPNSIRMLLRFGKALPALSPYQQASVILPKSPLYKKYHKLVTYTLQAPKPYFLQPSFGGFPSQGPGAPMQMVVSLQMPFSPPVRTVLHNGQVTYRPAPNTMPKHLNSLTLNVVQSAELRAIPISFVVPIGSQAPVHAAPNALRSFAR